ncbi:MAG: hypothetical protein M1812_005338 [Candelaria pacifica]|nr:MAG: hypothetical protein M1812_005338 [Candelaria pacifica]
MAPSSGQILIPMAVRIARQAFKNVSTLIRNKIPSASAASAEVQPILVRNTPRQPIHPAAFLRQSRGRWYTTHSAVKSAVRHFTSSTKTGVRFDRSSFPKSTIGSAVTRLPHRAPFASTLRPNLTGGALPRTAGGYSIGAGRAGGARYFSHTPAAPAQVVNNVSAAVRAFWLSGQKAQFNGVDPMTGEKHFKTVAVLQEEAGRKMRSVPRATPGSSIEFHISPTITALTPLSGLAPTSPQETETLNTEGILDVLSVDFARALKDLAAVLNDLKRLASLGDLTLTMSDKSTIKVHFPGCDSQTVERLCDEVGVERGIIHQDEGFDAYVGTEIALLFPFAPSQAPSDVLPYQAKHKREDVDWRNMLSPYEPTISPKYSIRSQGTDLGFEDLAAEEANPWLSTSPSGYSSLHASDEDIGGEPYYFETQPSMASAKQSASDYEGLEGIYRFLEQCDTARR